MNSQRKILVYVMVLMIGFLFSGATQADKITANKAKIEVLITPIKFTIINFLYPTPSKYSERG